MQTPKQLSNSIIVEQHPSEYNGYPFISLLQYKQSPIITIIDNIDEKNIKAYVLDLCNTEYVDEQVIIDVANEWYENNSNNYPISVEFGKRNLSSISSKLLKIYNQEVITRIIGPVFYFPVNSIVQIKRRKRRYISPRLLQIA